MRACVYICVFVRLIGETDHKNDRYGNYLNRRQPDTVPSSSTIWSSRENQESVIQYHSRVFKALKMHIKKAELLTVQQGDVIRHRVSSLDHHFRGKHYLKSYTEQRQVSLLHLCEILFHTNHYRLRNKFENLTSPSDTIFDTHRFSSPGYLHLHQALPFLPHSTKIYSKSWYRVLLKNAL